jgi:hypothetical protein
MADFNGAKFVSTQDFLFYVDKLYSIIVLLVAFNNHYSLLD